MRDAIENRISRRTFTNAPAVEEGEQIVCVMIAGYIDKPTLKDRIMIAQAHTKRKPISERLTADAPIPEWLQAGMEAVRPAPSAVNRRSGVRKTGEYMRRSGNA